MTGPHEHPAVAQKDVKVQIIGNGIKYTYDKVHTNKLQDWMHNACAHFYLRQLFEVKQG